MPFKSEQQRRFLWSQHPEIAKKWAHGEHSTKGNHKEAAQRKLKHLNKKNSSE